jgi:transcriptional regulator with XRE-family HTH domain
MIEQDTQRLETVRTNLRLAVALRRTNFAETARKSGMSRNAISQFVSGKTSLSYSNMLAVCDVLDVPIGILHNPDAITESKLKLYRLLRSMPENLASQALQLARDAESGDKGSTNGSGATLNTNSTS